MFITWSTIVNLKGESMQEMPLFPWWFTPALTVWAALGPFVGIFVGSYLSRSAQRRQWLPDNEINEWRELLTTLTSSFITIVGKNRSIPAVPSDRVERMKDDFDARMRADEVLTNRIFIARQVRTDDLSGRWRKALEEFDQDHDPTELGTAFGELNVLILRGASAHIGKV